MITLIPKKQFTVGAGSDQRTYYEKQRIQVSEATLMGYIKKGKKQLPNPKGKGTIDGKWISPYINHCLVVEPLDLDACLAQKKLVYVDGHEPKEPEGEASDKTPVAKGKTPTGPNGSTFGQPPAAGGGGE